MKIGLLIHQMFPEGGGAYSFQSSIVEAIARLKSNHEFYLFYYGKKCNNSDNKYIKIITFNTGNDDCIQALRSTFKSRIKKYIAKNDNVQRDVLFSLSDAVEKYKIELVWFITPIYEDVQVPYIYTVWDLQHRVQPFFPEVSVSGWKWEDREKWYQRVLPRAAYILTGTNVGKEEVKRFYGIDDERIRVLPLPMPSFCLNTSEHDNNQCLSPSIDSPFILYPAQFWPHKNHIVLLHAIKILKEKYRINVKVIFTGSDKGNLKFIKNKIKEFGLIDDAIIYGFVDFNVLINFYKSAVALVFPTFFGPDNLPPLEAFAFGCPVIASDVPGAREQLKDAALLFDPKNEEEIAQAIKLLFEKPVLREEMIKKGRDLASKWTSDHYVNGVVEIINEFEKYRRCWSSEEPYTHL